MARFGHVRCYFSLVFSTPLFRAQFSLHAIANEIRNLSRLLLLVSSSPSLPLYSRFYSFEILAHSIPLCNFFFCARIVCFPFLDRWLFTDRQQIIFRIFDAWTMDCFAYFLFCCLLATPSIIKTSKSHLRFVYLFICYSYYFFSSLTLLLWLCTAWIHNSNLVDCCTLFWHSINYGTEW